ncbi:CAP domain-containing protein [Halobacteriales archaeon QS_9_67_15]|nr:MAG: CAP domain-containing protein [Halobacteriales archaeon QS_9_67_15]
MVDVNKPTLLVAGGGVVALVVVAVLVGAALSQPNAPSVGGESTPTPVGATSLPPLETTTGGPGTATPSGPATATPTAYPTLTPTPSPTPTATPALTEVPADSFDEREVERLVATFINERRSTANYSTLGVDGTTVDRLTEMARGHSVDMADIGEAVHRIDGAESADRYRDSTLYDRCRWSAADSDSLVTADDNALEAVGTTVAGQPYTEDDERRFNGDEEAVARALVDSWWETDTYRQRLARPNASVVGVGVDITRRGDAFATVNLC